MDKIKLCLLSIVSLIGSFFCIEKVSAMTTENLIVEKQENVFYTMTNNYGYFSADPFAYYTMDGKTVYCIEQGVALYTHLYHGEAGFVNSPLPLEINRKIELIGHYGYDYPGHQTQHYRMATQALIWEAITGNNVNFYTENYGYGDYINIDYEREQIMNLVNNHYVKPSFDEQTFDVMLNQEFIIEDNNYKINDFEIYDANDNLISIKENKVYITPKKIGQSLIKFIKKNYDEATTFFYIADDGVSQKVAFFRSSDPLTTTVNLNVSGGKIKIIKQDSETNSCNSQGQATLFGAKYGVYDSNDNLVDTLVIDEDCTATSKDLGLGDYTIKELSASKGYTLDTKTYNVNINSATTIDVVSKEDVIKGKIKITKYDSETNSCDSQGQATLFGAKYGVYDSGDNLVDTLTITNDCTAISKALVFGNYKIKELSSSKGYKLDTNVYNVDINSETIINVISKEDIIKNRISILKQYEYVDENSTLLKAEANITFEIYSTNGKKYREITTDQNGYSTFELPYGVWTFHQLNTKKGYLKVNDFQIIVDENSNKVQYYNVLNNKLSAYVQVFKIDADTKQVIALANTTFKILNLDTNEYVKQYVAGRLIDEFKTDENGQFVTYLKLYAGHYRLVEISSPKNYLLNDNGLDFVIDDETDFNYDEHGAFITLYFEDHVIKGRIKINKKGEQFIIENGKYGYKEIPLDNVVYEIYANEDIYSVDGKTLYFKKGQLVDTLTTDKNGYAISKELYLGSYYLVEIKTKDNYVLNTEQFEFILTEKDNKTAIVYESYSTLNYLKKGTLEFSKTDLATGEGIANTIIEIYTEDDELIFTGKTDKNGEIKIPDLFVGKFYIVEKEASTGYKISDEKVYFEIKENGEIVKANMTNEKIKSKVKLHKVDENNDALEGVTIGLYDLNDNLLETYVTDSNGDIEIELEYGSYYFQEISTLDGYILSDEKVFFDVNKNGDFIQKTLINEFEEIEVPNTYKNAYDLSSIISLLITILGISLIIYAKKSEK